MAHPKPQTHAISGNDAERARGLRGEGGSLKLGSLLGVFFYKGAVLYGGPKKRDPKLESHPERSLSNPYITGHQRSPGSFKARNPTWTLKTLPFLGSGFGCLGFRV